MWVKACIVAGLLCSVLGVPHDGFPADLNQRLGQYMPPGPGDSRGPCPALNTLANHGLINRNGQNINSDDLTTAFARGFGINGDGIVVAIQNFGAVCHYVMVYPCQEEFGDSTFTFTNLTLLGLAHAFEHDHSFSREDYKQAYAHGALTDNIFFNSTEFKTSLDVIGYTPSNPPVKKLANYQNFNQIRLQRESIQNTVDLPGWFIQNIPVQLFEVGFIFGAMFDRDSNGNMIGTTPMVRVDWWNFWFSEESFPTQLGWVPASTTFFNNDFITSVSSAVLTQPITSTPTNLPPSATNPSASAASELPPQQDPSSVFPLFAGTAYIAPTAPSNIKSEVNKRAVETARPAIGSIPPALSSAVHRAVGPAPTPFNWFQEKLDVSHVAAQIQAAQSYESAVQSALASLIPPVGP